MTFYAFNKCQKENLPELTKLISKLGLEEIKFESNKNLKQWRGEPLNEPQLITLEYRPTENKLNYEPKIEDSEERYPLRLITQFKNCKNPEYITHKTNHQLKKIVKQIFDITDSSKIVNCCSNNYNLNEFKE